MAKTLGPAGAEKGTIKEVTEQIAKTMEAINPDVEKTLKAISEAYREADPDKYAMNLPAYNPEITGENYEDKLPYYYPVITDEEPEYKSKLPYYHYPDLLPRFPEDLDPGFHGYPEYPEDNMPIIDPDIDPGFHKCPDPGFHGYPEDKFPIGPYFDPDFHKGLPKEFPDDILPNFPDLPEFPEDFDPDKGPDGTETCPECHRPYPEDKLPIDETLPERNYPGLPGFPDRRGQVINFAENEPQGFIDRIKDIIKKDDNDKDEIARKRAEQAESLVQDVKSSIELDSPQAGE